MASFLSKPTDALLLLPSRECDKWSTNASRPMHGKSSYKSGEPYKVPLGLGNFLMSSNTLTCAKQIPDTGQRHDRPKGLLRIPKMEVSYFDERCYSQ
ncbi:hypothetical protein ACTXT7_002880 [Hymenolepis weldensis]